MPFKIEYGQTGFFDGCFVNNGKVVSLYDKEVSSGKGIETVTKVIMAYIVAIILLAAGDLWVKGKIEAQKPEGFPRPLQGTKEKIWLYRNHNPGFPFGFLKKYEELVRSIPLAVTSALAGVMAVLMTKKGGRVQKTALALIIGGSVSNLYDRYFRHYVVDYFSLRLGPLKKVVFNLGDIFIFMGSGLLFLCRLTQETRDALRSAKKQELPCLEELPRQS